MYTYEPLADPEREIRLASLQPGAFNDPICITFQSHNLENDHIDYEALSYAWGSPDDPSVVQIESHDQAPLSITRNLDVALRYLRFAARSRTMWIDALCIDQSSTYEKSHQVAFMGDIYASASCVVVWLGPKQAGSDQALDIIEHVSNCIDVDFEAETLQPSPHCPDSEKHFGDESVILPFENSALDPVVHLIERPYFNRIWIRQEFAFANHGIIYCGDRQLDMQDFRKAMLCFFLKALGSTPVSESLYLAFINARTRLYYLCNVRPGTCSWTSIRHLMGDAQCQDPRDRIYALLAFLHESEPMHDLRPDYSITTQQLYTYVASQTIIKQQSLELLEFCDLALKTHNIPSWAPDWTSPVTQATRSTQGSACGWITSNCSIVDGTLLNVTGTSISYVDEVIEIALPLRMSTKRACKKVAGILHKLEPSEEELEARGWSKRRWAEMLCTIAAGCEFQESYYPPDKSRLKLNQIVDVVEAICFTKFKAAELLTRTDLELERTIDTFRFAWPGFAFVKCSDGRIGLANPDVQRGDLISVLLGCRYPMVLRPCPQRPDDRLWQVVCPLMVGDLMDGQAICGSVAMSHLRAVRPLLGTFNEEELIDRRPRGMYDERTGRVRTNPAEILTEMGIKVEMYQRNPHRLEVLPETLRNVGVDLQEFILV